MAAEDVPGTRYIIVYGNPVSGVAFEGPFPSHEEAAEHAEANVENSWWIAELFPALELDGKTPPPKEGAATVTDDLVGLVPFVPRDYEGRQVSCSHCGNMAPQRRGGAERVHAVLHRPAFHRDRHPGRGAAAQD
jgi:hypothetical protein